MSDVHETKFLVQHKSCQCNCRLNERICKSKQRFNHNECQSECKVLDDRDSCKNDYTWNPSTCDCEWNKEYLDIINYFCKKYQISKLVLEEY